MVSIRYSNTTGHLALKLIQLYEEEAASYVMFSRKNDLLDGGSATDYGDGGNNIDSCPNVEKKKNCES